MDSDYLPEEPRPILQQLDQVEILTVKRVKYLSARPGHAPSPHGRWNVVGLIEGEALLAKDSALVRIPLGDIKKVYSYDRQEVIDYLAEICYRGKSNK
jgi:hypothetical protein